MKFTEDGKYTLGGQEGTWELIDERKIKCTLDGECTYEFNKKATKAKLVEPDRDPAARLVLTGLVEDEEDEDEEKDKKKNVNVIEVLRLYCYKFNENSDPPQFERTFSTTLDVFKKQTD